MVRDNELSLLTNQIHSINFPYIVERYQGDAVSVALLLITFCFTTSYRYNQLQEIGKTLHIFPLKK